MTNIVFITGTDTGVGKTILTALLLAYARAQGCHALAMKPFSSGDRSDAELLWQMQDHELPLDVINPFHFKRPVAPLVGAQQARCRVSLSSVVKKIERLADGCERLLIEGAGGLLVPLGTNYTVADLIAALRCPVVVVAANKLGTINHTALTVAHLRTKAVPQIRVALMDVQKPDPSALTNQRLIAAFAAPDCLVSLPYLGPKVSTPGVLKKAAKNLQKPLAKLWWNDIVCASFRSRKARKEQ